MAFAQQNNRIVKISPRKGITHHHYYQHETTGKGNRIIDVWCHDNIRLLQETGLLVAIPHFNVLIEQHEELNRYTYYGLSHIY